MNNKPMETVQDDSRFSLLIQALASGWEIEEPVLVRATWRSDSYESGAYHFVLRKRAEDKTTLLSLRPSVQLLAFLATHNISVSRL